MANDIKLQEGHPVDENLRPIKVGGKSTAIETAQHGNGARITGGLEVSGAGKSIVAEPLVTNNIISASLIIYDSGSVIIQPTGDNSSLYVGKPNSKRIQLNSVEGGSGSSISLYSILDEGDYCNMKTLSNGATTLATFDDVGNEADLTLNIDGFIDMNSAGGEDITLDSGRKIILDSVNEINLNTTGASIKMGSYGDFNPNGYTSAGFGFTFHSVLDTNDYFRIDTTTLGATTITTVDDGGTGANLTLNIDGKVDINSGGSEDIELDAGGDIILDSNDGNFIARKAGTEFSADNSAYAGMILGYTRIANDGTGSTDNAITVNSSAMTVLQTTSGTDFSIQFTVPPSGNVEIQCSFWFAGLQKGAKFSLSTDPSYAELGITHTYDADYTVYIDETDHDVTNISFAVTGLTAGTDTTYYLAGLASSAGAYINHGRMRLSGNHFPPIILKAIALPADIVTGE